MRDQRRDPAHGRLKGAERIVAVNKDADAPIMTMADYAVVGDLHQVVPALTAEIRRRTGAIGPAALACVCSSSLAVGRHALRAPRPPARALVRIGGAEDRVARHADARAQPGGSLGQRKLFQRLVPGLMHAFIFWGFLVLLPTIVRRMLAVVDPDWTLPWLGTRAGSRCSSTSSRARARRRRHRVLHPQGAATAPGSRAATSARPTASCSRSPASSSTLLLWHATRIALGPERVPAAVAGIERPLATCSAAARGTEVAERVFVWAHLLLVPRVPRLPAGLQAPAHRHGGRQRLLRPHARPRPARAAAVRRRGRRGRHALRRRHRRRPDVEAGPRHLLVHRVRPLPGRLPRLGHRQAALAQAADHGPARPPVRRGPAGARRGRRRRFAAPAARPERRRRRGRVGLRDLRRLRAGVPGRHRAHRPHRRPAAQPRDGGVAVPRRSRRPAARDRSPGENPWGSRSRRGRVGRGPGRARAAAGRRRPRGALLGRVRGAFDERAREVARATARCSQRGRRRLRDPRPAGGVHRRPRPAHGQRVPVPDVRRAERGDARTRPA